MTDHQTAGATTGAGQQPPEQLDRGILVLGLVIVCGLIMSILDTTIVNVALGTLSQDLNAPLSTVQWVVTGYMLAIGTVISLTGWAVDRFGARRLWLLSIILFVVGSVLSGMAWSIESLIGFRVLQGLGGGMLMPVGQSILATAAGPQRLGRVMSLIGIPMMLGPVLGPILGGLIVETLDWHWIFYVNLPVGILALVLAVRLLPADDPGDRTATRLDVRGLLLLPPGLVAIIYGLSQASEEGGFTSASALGWLGVGAVLVGLFVLHSLRRGDQALIDVRLFADRTFSAAAGTVFLIGTALFGAILLLPLYYQLVHGETPLTAGLLLAPQGIGSAWRCPWPAA